MDGTIDRICTALAVPSRWAEAEMAVGDAMGTQGHLGDSGEELTPGRPLIGGSVDALHERLGDSADEDDAREVIRRRRLDRGPVDVLVHNAGIMWVGSFDEEPGAAARAQLGVDLLGVINGIKTAAPAMREAGHGHLITVASAASILPTPGEATYAATKHGVLGYFKAVRTEMRGTGVHFTAVVRAVARPRFEITVPGFIGPVTRLADLLPQPVRDRIFGAVVPDQVAQVRADARAGYEEAAFTTSRAGRGQGWAASAE